MEKKEDSGRVEYHHEYVQVDLSGNVGWMVRVKAGGVGMG
jgi:hypothetical protein